MKTNLIRKRRLVALRNEYLSLFKVKGLSIVHGLGNDISIQDTSIAYNRQEVLRNHFQSRLEPLLQRTGPPEQVDKLLETLWSNSMQFNVIIECLAASSDPLDELKTKDEGDNGPEEDFARIALTDWNILIVGETGSGKEVCAEKIHYLSNRKDKPFNPFNCAGRTRELFYGLLFGHKKGAFTGAIAASEGIIGNTNEGTVFLDELGDLSDECQAALLRFVNNKNIEPLGEKSKIADVRIIAATNRPSKIRDDLLHRFQKCITLPPLRECKRKILHLAPELFRKSQNAANKANLKKESLRFLPEDIIDLSLQDYNWPGNIRELQSAMEQAVFNSKGRKLKCDAIIKEAREYNRLLARMR